MSFFQKTASGFRAAFITIIMGATTINADAKIKMLHISSAAQKIQLKNYRIAKVVDDRTDKKSIGYITTGAHNYFLAADFRQSVADELQQFINENTLQGIGKSEEVTLHVYDYFLSEKSSFKGAEIAIRSHFALFNKAGHRILDHSSMDTRNTGMNMGANAEEVMCRNLTGSLVEMDKKVPASLALYNSDQPIKVSYVFVKEPMQKHLLPYNPQRPLNVRNFTGRAPVSSTAPAQAQCGLQVSYQIRSAEGKAEAFIELLPYFDQANSWLKSGENLRERLAYEQTYFKISAFVTNELIEELEAKTFTFNNLKPGIEELQQKYITKMKELQTQYQQETEYGKNEASMEKWSRQIAFYPAYAQN